MPLFLTIDDIIEVNKKVVKVTNEGHVVLSRGNLEYIVEKVYGNQNHIDNAATYFYDIITVHPFLGGNKRTAFAVADVYLKANKLEFVASKLTLEKLAYKCARNEIDYNKLRKLFRKIIK